MNQKYKLATIQNDEWVYVYSFDNYEELIDFLARYQEGFIDYREKSILWNNRYLDNINMNFNDSYNYSYWNGSGYDTINRTYEYIFIREDGAIVDVRLFYDDIIKKYEEYQNKKYYYSKKEKQKYEYRKDPVPNTGVRIHNRTRKVGYGRLVKMLNHPDFQQYNRSKKYKDMLDPWHDYPYKYVDRCWKSSFKCRKQWGKHIDKK